jgi:hypothetical protein
MLDNNLSSFASSLLDSQNPFDFPKNLTKTQTISIIRQLVNEHPLDYNLIIHYATKVQPLSEPDLLLLQQ